MAIFFQVHFANHAYQSLLNPEFPQKLRPFLTQSHDDGFFHKGNFLDRSHRY